MRKIAVALSLVALLAGGAIAEDDLELGFPWPDQGERYGFDFGPRSGLTCMTEYQTRQFLEDHYGFSHVLFGVFNDGEVPVKATQDGWVYLMTVNYCSGRVLEKRQFQPA